MGRPRCAASAVKRVAELAVCGHAAGDEQGVRAVVLGCGEGFALEIVDDCALEGGEEIERLLVAERYRSGFRLWRELLAPRGDGGGQVVCFDVAQDRGFDAAEAEGES